MNRRDRDISIVDGNGVRIITIKDVPDFVPDLLIWEMIDGPAECNVGVCR